MPTVTEAKNIASFIRDEIQLETKQQGLALLRNIPRALGWLLFETES